VDQDVKAGKFREDLFYRLSVVTLRVPALRERRTDIPLLAEGFLATVREREGHTPLVLSEETQRTLVAYSWPGNVRTLYRMIERYGIESTGE
jgi:DNA-binding NtrC family response regulator